MGKRTNRAGQQLCIAEISSWLRVPGSTHQRESQWTRNGFNSFNLPARDVRLPKARRRCWFNASQAVAQWDIHRRLFICLHAYNSTFGPGWVGARPRPLEGDFN